MDFLYNKALANYLVDGRVRIGVGCLSTKAVANYLADGRVRIGGGRKPLFVF
jgi:hypothetical protein